MFKVCCTWLAAIKYFSKRKSRFCHCVSGLNTQPLLHLNTHTFCNHIFMSSLSTCLCSLLDKRLVHCSIFLLLVTCLMIWCKCSSTWLPGNPAENQGSRSLADEQVGSGVVSSSWNYCRRFSLLISLLYFWTDLTCRLQRDEQGSLWHDSRSLASL